MKPPPPPTSAFHPAVVAQMCRPITHLYSSSSLQVIDGKLAPYLSKVIKFASSHVFSCSLCREKGFICELCHNGQVIYPFQESAIKRYSSSHTVYSYIFFRSLLNKYLINPGCLFFVADVDLNRFRLKPGYRKPLWSHSELNHEWRFCRSALSVLLIMTTCWHVQETAWPPPWSSALS